MIKKNNKKIPVFDFKLGDNGIRYALVGEGWK